MIISAEIRYMLPYGHEDIDVPTFLASTVCSDPLFEVSLGLHKRFSADFWR